MSNCHRSPSQMCPGRVYRNCPLNTLNFWEVICIYYEIYKFKSPQAVLVNLPIIIFTLPLLPPALIIYLFYLLALPVSKVFGEFFPSLIPIMIPLVFFFIIGQSKTRLGVLFKR